MAVKLISKIESSFNDSVWDVMGDSITEFNEYQQTVQSIIGFKTINEYGVSGTCLTSVNESDTTSFSYRAANMDFTADLITVFGGTNDWGNLPPKPLGIFGDIVSTTVYGAIDNIINTILTNAPTKRLAFITPLQRDFRGISSTCIQGWSEITVNPLGYKLSDITDAVIEVCWKYGIPVLDLYHTSGITKLNISQMTRDGLHPAAATGMVRIGQQIAKFLNTL